MGDRSRSLLIASEMDNFSQVGTYTSPSGTCTSPPGTTLVASGIGTVSGTYQSIYEYQQMSDVVTPNFRKRVANGEIINSPMTKTYVSESIPKVKTEFSSMASKWGCSPARYYEYIQHRVAGTLSMRQLCGSDLFMDAPEIDETSLKDQAISRAWANIDMSEIFALSTLKELDQTIVGLMYIMKKVYKIFRIVAKHDINLRPKRKRRSELGKELSLSELKEIYMNARYNLRPLAYDVVGIMNVLNAPMTKAMRQTFRGNLSKSVSNSDNIEKYAFYHSNIDLKATIHRSVQKEVSVRAGVLCDIKPLTYFDLLGGDEIVATAWDLLPFSFIIDWFCNAGDTIIAWSPNLRTQTLASWVVKKTITTQTSTILGSQASARNGTYFWTNTTGNVSSGTAWKISIDTERIPEYSRPTIPSFRLNLDPLKLLDLGIILTGLKSFKYASQG